jgi:uncharacterized protein YcfJ
METTMTHRLTTLLAAATLALGVGTTSAYADACSGHHHTTGTVLGAVGGGAIGSAVSHGSLGGVVAGAVLGGLAGNAISRDADCHRHYRGYHHRRYHHESRYYWRNGHRYARW